MTLVMQMPMLRILQQQVASGRHHVRRLGYFQLLNAGLAVANLSSAVTDWFVGREWYWIVFELAMVLWMSYLYVRMVRTRRTYNHTIAALEALIEKERHEPTCMTAVGVYANRTDIHGRRPH